MELLVSKQSLSPNVSNNPSDSEETHTSNSVRKEKEKKKKNKSKVHFSLIIGVDDSILTILSG